MKFTNFSLRLDINLFYSVVNVVFYLKNTRFCIVYKRLNWIKRVDLDEKSKLYQNERPKMEQKLE